MASGYTRQSAANITPGLPIQSADINNEFNQLVSAFGIVTGHDHSGSSPGTGAPINASTAITGTLPVIHGGTGGTTSTGSGAVVLQTNPQINNIYATTPILHEGLGGIIYHNAHTFCKGDYTYLHSADPSLGIVATITGAVTPGNTPGVRFTLSAVNYDCTYTVLVADTNNDIALGIALAIENNSSLRTALALSLDQQGFGQGDPFQIGAAAQTSLNTFAFNAPWVAGNTATPISNGTTTVTLTDIQTGGATPRMDGGPFPIYTRWYPVGYVLANGDQGPIITCQHRIGAAGYIQTSFIKNVFTAATSNQIQFGNYITGTTDIRMTIGSGISTYPGPGDQGAGIIAAQKFYSVTAAGVDNILVVDTTSVGNAAYMSLKQAGVERYTIASTNAHDFNIRDVVNGANFFTYNGTTAQLRMGTSTQLVLTNGGGVSIGGVGSSDIANSLTFQGTTLEANYILELPNNAAKKAKANAWDTYSDSRIKTNVNSIDDGLALVRELNPVHFNQHNSSHDENGNLIIEEEYKETFGLIAQEVYKILPAIVNSSDDTNELWGLDYARLTAYLVAAIKDLSVQNKELLSRIELLESK